VRCEPLARDHRITTSSAANSVDVAQTDIAGLLALSR
jgi:hypothetical protein